MLRYWFCMLTILVTLVTASRCNITMAAPNVNFIHATRMIYDGAALQFETLNEPNSTWVVAEITPSPTSGQTKGMTKDPQTGQLTQTPGSRIVRVLDGSIKVVVTLVGSPQKDVWNYKFEKPSFIAAGLVGTPINSQDKYLPFFCHSTVICRLNKEATTDPDNPTESEFFPLYVIPSEWQQSVMPAFQFYQTNSKLFQVATAAQHHEQLLKLIEEENPFLAIAAWRTLVQAHRIEESLIQGPLARSIGFKQAVLTYVLLTHSAKDAQSKLTEQISRIVENADNSAQLEGLAWGTQVALGAGVKGTTRSEQYAVISTTMQQRFVLLTKMQKRQLSFGTRSPADEHLFSIFRRARVPKEKPTVTTQGVQEPKP
ncbi:MAG: hypothetical protein M3347_10440 [Armatimonadota bacterium]|nr:hypothetical protein [Armatimonadota bacterium]